jgi:hypothetical protein
LTNFEKGIRGDARNENSDTNRKYSFWQWRFLGPCHIRGISRLGHVGRLVGGLVVDHVPQLSFYCAVFVRALIDSINSRRRT